MTFCFNTFELMIVLILFMSASDVNHNFHLWVRLRVGGGAWGGGWAKAPGGKFRTRQ